MKTEERAMNIALPPMGWNSWNTFGPDISDQLIVETARAMKEKGYLEKGYEYVVIDDIWSLHERDENVRLVPDPEKFPRGMKALADDIHALGFKFGMYSCAGLLTCAGYPSSFDHEFIDAQTFADWGVDFLKYDFCNFPPYANGRQRYAMMSMALKATGRDILFSACNWGTDEPWKWMDSIGVHMYRSTGDIHDNFQSFTDIAKSQLNNFCMSGPHCFNDIDMLTIGMYGKGNVALGEACTTRDYQTQFALWCMLSAPLMLGGDVRRMDPDCESLLKNDGLLRINQDPECRPPQIVYRGRVVSREADPATGGRWHEYPDCGLTLFKHLSGGEFAIGYFNFAPLAGEVPCLFADAGLPAASGFGLRLRDAMTGRDLGLQQDRYDLTVDGHGCRVLLGRLEKIG
ncbi:MAG: glycoside hydrolase family 27 protein [Clostridia bacterium]|nr:glycoside hydrolase family 27 protein [Clostridia bacterium]